MMWARVESLVVSRWCQVVCEDSQNPENVMLWTKGSTVDHPLLTIADVVSWPKSQLKEICEWN
jgi:hypothetical protein